MNRQTLTDESGRWFDIDAAKSYEESTWHDGNNHISYATGSQWGHERLHRTAGGRWILNHWSQWQGSIETWVEIDDAAAAVWLSTNEHEPHEACAAEFAALEVQ